MQVQPQDAPCGALIRGVDLSRPLTGAQVAGIRRHWLKHQVVAFVDQDLSVEDIERFALTVGPFGSDPFFEAIPGHPHVAQVRREADEKTPIFAEVWHSDWSFMAQPPAATVLYGNVIPPVGGDTRFTDLYAAWETLPAGLKTQVEGRRAIHSAGRAYARDGAYGEKDKGRSMKIRYSDDALHAQYAHPIGRVHPETGRTALFVSMGYTVGIEGMSTEEATPILHALFAHQNRKEFEYSHRWSQGTLLMWDNRCVNHAASGGYDGHARLLHRITVADRTFQ
ncbi:MAG: TauD/TfdA family dioxygenase [Ottowia sp.]|uniref:TauD/TfdA dioxygenase family protein n=1 Tax=Ottowia sp. TaxID=1898956 RepID=UPI0039E5130A